MVEIGGKPILWHIMRHYLRHGFNHFVLALGYKGEHIKRYMVDYRTYNDSNLSVDMHNGDVKTVSTTTPLSEAWTVDLIETGTKAETGARIKRIVPYLGDETFMLTYGDGVSDVDLSKLVEFHRSHGKLATMTVVHPPARFGRVRDGGGSGRRASSRNRSSPASTVGRSERGGSTAGSSCWSRASPTTSTTTESTKWELEPLEGLASRRLSSWPTATTRSGSAWTR